MRRDASAHQYAKAVVDGRLVTGEFVYKACRRHLDDLDAGVYTWDNRPLEFFERWVSAMPVNDNSDDGGGLISFKLLPWQRFFIGSILCWVVGKNDKLARTAGTRRFREAILFTAKGSGKSTLAAMLGGFLLTNDGWYHPDTSELIKRDRFHGVIMGVKEEQVRNVGLSVLAEALEAAGLAVQGTSHHAEVQIMGGYKAHTLIYAAGNAKLQTIATTSSGTGVAGWNVAYVHAEEVAQWTNTEQLDYLTKGFKADRQPLLLALSNSGAYPDGVGWDFRNRGIECNEVGGSERTFGLIYECDKSDMTGSKKRWYPVKRVWPKANPSLGVTIRRDYIFDEIERAGNDEHERNKVRQLIFGDWPKDGGSMFPPGDWDKVKVDSIDPPRGSTCYIGLDLADSLDFSALAAVFVTPDNKILARVKFWLPERSLEIRSQLTTVPLKSWERDGLLEIAGGHTFDPTPLVREIERLDAMYTTEFVADRYKITRVLDRLESSDIRLVPETQAEPGDRVLYLHPQRGAPITSNKTIGLWMEDSIDKTVSLIADGDIAIEASPVLDWNLNSVAVISVDNIRRIANRTKPVGGKPARGSIDGLVALVMAIGLMSKKPKKQERRKTFFELGYKLKQLEI